jgi:hypothetical protein
MPTRKICMLFFPMRAMHTAITPPSFDHHSDLWQVVNINVEAPHHLCFQPPGIHPPYFQTPSFLSLFSNVVTARIHFITEKRQTSPYNRP